MVSTFDDTITTAVNDGIIPGVLLLATNTSGSLSISKVLGSSSIAPGAEKPLTKDAVFPLMSMTKLLTTIAVLQLVEQGKLALDEDVTPKLPVLAAQKVLTGFDDDGKPQLVDRKGHITLRQLLTHSAGCGYDFLSPDIQKFLAATGGTVNPPGQGPDVPVDERFGGLPLLYQPGEGWQYGTAVDWAGRLVELASGTDLEAYVQKHVLAPVGAVDVSFFPHRHPGMVERLWGSLSARDGESGKAVHTPFGYAGASHALGGQGAYADLTQYFKVLESLLRDDGRLLRSETVRDMCRPQLSAKSKAALINETKHPEWIVGDIPDTGEYDWGLGGLLVDGGSHGWRKTGALMWSGAFNLTWLLDREAGVAAIFATLMVPPGDAKCKELMRAWEEHVYSQAKK